MCLPLVAGVISGIGSIMSLQAQAASAKAQQQALDRQAQIQQNIGAYEGKRQEENVRRAIGSQRAGVAASGIALDGSAADALAESATEGALDVAAIRWNAGMKADTSRYEAKVAGMNAKAAGAAMPFAFLTPVLKGAAQMSGPFDTWAGAGGR